MKEAQNLIGYNATPWAHLQQARIHAFLNAELAKASAPGHHRYVHADAGRQEGTHTLSLKSKQCIALPEPMLPKHLGRVFYGQTSCLWVPLADTFASARRIPEFSTRVLKNSIA